MTTPTTPNATSDDLSNDVVHLSEHVGRLLTSTEVAEVIRVPHATLRYWRHIGIGPKSFKMGPRQVLYREEDVWLGWLTSTAPRARDRWATSPVDQTGSWRARYRDLSGREHSKHFARKVDAQRWLDEARASMLSGQYVDPRAGRITLRGMPSNGSCARSTAPDRRPGRGVLKRHILPALGDRRLGSILPSDIQRWIRRLSETLAPSTVGVCRILSSIFKSAVADRRIVSNPCTGPAPQGRQAQGPADQRRPALGAILEEMERHRRSWSWLPAPGCARASSSGSRSTASTLTRAPSCRPPADQHQRARALLRPAQVPGECPHSPASRTVVDILRVTCSVTPPIASCSATPTTSRCAAPPSGPSGAGRQEQPDSTHPLPRLRHYYASLLIRHGSRSRRCKPDWGTRAPARPSTPTATCGRTPTSAPGTLSTWPSAPLRTICGQPPPPEDKRAGHRARGG